MANAGNPEGVIIMEQLDYVAHALAKLGISTETLILFPQ